MNYEEAYNILINATGSIETINALSIAVGAIKKQIPRKPVKVIDNGTGTRCPKCNKTLLANWKPSYCMCCGQAIDWSGLE